MEHRGRCSPREATAAVEAARLTTISGSPRARSAALSRRSALPRREGAAPTNRRWLNINRRSVLLPIISPLTNGKPGGRGPTGWTHVGAGRDVEFRPMSAKDWCRGGGAQRPARGGASPWPPFPSASVRTAETFVQLSIKVTWGGEPRLLLSLMPWLHL